MAFSHFLASALFGLLALATHVYADGTGDGTAYSGPGDKDATGFNSCQFGKLDDHWEVYYAALPSGSFDKGSDCGRCIAVKGLDAGASGKWIKAMVVDECASCSGGDVDFSTTALQEITGFSWDRKRIQWKWTDCDSTTVSSDEEQPASDGDSSPSPSNEEDSPKEIEGDLNGNGKLSKSEKRKLRKKQREAERESSNRKLLSVRV